MDGLDKLLLGFLAVWIILLLGALARAAIDRRLMPRSVFLPWLNQVFIALSFLALHHPAFRRAYPAVAPALLLAWGGCAVWGMRALSQKARKAAV